MRPFQDTLTANAHHYLDSSGNELTRAEFLADNAEWHGVMLYVGGGYCPLQIAVLTNDARGFHSLDVGAAVSTFEEWARNNSRMDEIGEDVPCDDPVFGEYELVFQSIPQEVIE